MMSARGDTEVMRLIHRDALSILEIRDMLDRVQDEFEHIAEAELPFEGDEVVGRIADLCLAAKLLEKATTGLFHSAPALSNEDEIQEFADDFPNPKLASYDEAIRVARDLNDDFSNTEYLRGQAELIADLYGRVGVELGDRTIEVTNELKSGGEGNPKPGEPDYGDISEDQPPAHIDLQVEAADARAVQAATDAALSIETVKSANLRTSQLVGQSIAGVVYDGSVGIEFDVRLTRDGWVVNDDGGEEFSDLDLATALTKAINFNNG